MGIVSILLGSILLIGFVGGGFFVSDKLAPLFMAVPNFFGDIKPSVVIVGIFALIGMIIFLNFLMSGIALLKISALKKRLDRIRKRKTAE